MTHKYVVIRAASNKNADLLASTIFNNMDDAKTARNLEVRRLASESIQPHSPAALAAAKSLVTVYELVPVEL